MKNIIQYIVTASLFFLAACGQAEGKNKGAIDLKETVSFLSDNGTKSINAVVTNNQGNVYVVGGSRPLQSPLWEVSYGEPNNSNQMDGFLAKYSSFGETLDFIIYLGGSGNDFATSVALSPNGDVVVVGVTYSKDFPVQNSESEVIGSRSDGFVAVYNKDGQLKSSRYIGGTWPDYVSDVFIDSFGSIFVSGWTESLDFPKGFGTGTDIQGRADGFVVKLNSLSLDIELVSVFGGGLTDQATSVYVDSDSSIYVAGNTSSPVFSGQPRQVRSGVSPSSMDVFLTKLNKSDLKIEYTSIMGGSHSDFAHSIVADNKGAIYMVGETFSNDFPVIPSQALNLNGRKDAFVIKASSVSGAVVASTMIGGNASDSISEISIASNGNVNVVGSTGSEDFPGTQEGSFNGGSRDAFYSSLDPASLRIKSTQYLGGGQYDDANAIVSDLSCGIYIAGRTGSSNLIVANRLAKSNTGGGSLDGYLMYSPVSGCL